MKVSTYVNADASQVFKEYERRAHYYTPTNPRLPVGRFHRIKAFFTKQPEKSHSEEYQKMLNLAVALCFIQDKSQGVDDFIADLCNKEIMPEGYQQQALDIRYKYDQWKVALNALNKEVCSVLVEKR